MGDKPQLEKHRFDTWLPAEPLSVYHVSFYSFYQFILKAFY